MKQLYICKKNSQRYLKTASLFVFALIISMRGLIAQSDLNWTGNKNSDARDPENWTPQMSVVNNNLIVDSAHKFTNNPIFGGTSFTVNNLNWLPTSYIKINLNEPTNTFTVNTETPTIRGNVDIEKGAFVIRRCEIRTKTTRINVFDNGELRVRKYLFFGASSGDNNTEGGYLYIYGKGKVVYTAEQATDGLGRFTADTNNGGVLKIVDEGVLELRKWNNITYLQQRIQIGNISTIPGRELYIEYDAVTNTTYVRSRPDSILVIQPKSVQNIISGNQITPLTIVKNRGYTIMDSIVWKYSQKSGGPYIPFTPNMVGVDTLKYSFNESGVYYVVAIGYKNGIIKEISNEVKIVVSSDKVSISPIISQLLKKDQEGYPITVTELETPSSREWVYTTTPGENYISFNPPQTDTILVPIFNQTNKYYVACKSIINGLTHISNEVEINVVDTTFAGEITWLGLADSIVTNMINWNPIAKIYNNILKISPDYSRRPVLNTSGRHIISGLNLAQDADFVIDFPSKNDTLYRGADVSISGNLIVRNGVFHINGRLRLESGKPSVLVSGEGRIVMQGSNPCDFIVGNSARSLGAEYIKIIDEGSIHGGDKVWRFANDTTKSVIKIGDHGIFTLNGNKIAYINADDPGIEWAVNRKQIMVDEESPDRVLVYYYDKNKNLTIVTTRFSAIPTNPILTKANRINEVYVVNNSDIVSKEWKVSTKSGGPYESFVNPQIADTLKVAFDKPGNYYIICEGVAQNGKTYITNEVEIVIPEVKIVPSVPIVINPFTISPQLTVQSTVSFTTPEWLYSTTSGSGYKSFPEPIYSDKLEFFGEEEGRYYVVCKVIIDTLTYYSDELPIYVMTVTVDPLTQQTIKANENGLPITVTTSIPNDGIEWKYSTTSGGPYQSFATPQIGDTYTPNFANSGIYYVVAEIKMDNNKLYTNEIQIVVTPGTGINETMLTGVHVYPNPAKDQIFVKSNFDNFKVEIVDLMGKVVFSKNYHNVTEVVQLSLNKGIYLVRVIPLNGKPVIQRLIVE